MSYFIDVILPIPLDKHFTYQINKTESEYLFPGMRVAVQFGKSKIYTAIVFQVHQNPPLLYEAKEIEHILDEQPIVTEEQLQFWNWISSYYLCSIGEVMRAALPGSFLLESETVILKNFEEGIDESLLKDDEFLIYEALQHQSLLKVQEITEITGKKNALPIIKRLLEKKIIKVEEEIYEKYTPKIVKYIKVHPRLSSENDLQEALDVLKRAPKQKDLLLQLFSETTSHSKPVKTSDFLKKSNSSRTVLRGLIEKEIVEEYELQQDRIQFDEGDQDSIKRLNDFQNRALKEIEDCFHSKSVCLLHGVTSSGKTEIYAQLIKKYLAKGKQILYLLPEIALTTQLIQRLENYFGKDLKVFHSKYSVNERIETWISVQSSENPSQVIIGARSAIFLPFRNLGLVIVDEEHELSFKQFDPAPRYHARDSAIVLASVFKAKVLLGSATPSIESYHHSQNGKYGLVKLDRRFGNILMPEINLIDLKTKQRKKQVKGHFSDTLIDAITETLNEKEQVIIFQNRRGYSPILECNTCGHTPQCPNCDVSLTYHQHRNQLRCHYCGYHMAKPQICMVCQSADLTTKGLGTQQIEEELKTYFPDHITARMDQDTTKGKHSYEKLIHSFENKEIDILVGTQMLSKGLDFRDVTLVGVMNADAILNFPDFRAGERCFQLLQQVSGRAGRTKKRGKVLIQSYNPYHQILQQVTTNDYEAMYKDQMEERRVFKYPPFYRLIKITCRHKDFSKVQDATKWLALSLRNYFEDHVLGPEFPPVSRIRNQYHKNVLLKIPQGQSLIKTKTIILKINKSFQSIKEFTGVRIIINVDNY